MKTIKFIGFLGSGLLLAAGLWAEPQIATRVSSTDISLNDSITLTIEISGVSNVSNAPSPSIPGFQIQSAGQTQSYQWVNGQSSSLIAFNYILTPTNSGTFQIPPINLNSDGKSASSQPINITVRPGSSTGTPSGSNQSNQQDSTGAKSISVPSEGLKPVFLTANTDVKEAYVGQQILLSIQFIRRPDIRLASQPRYSEPDMTGFIVEPMKQQEFTTTIQGVQYQVTELRYALFPTSDGEFVIGSANVDLAVHTQIDPFDPNGFFQGFFGRSQTVKLNTRAIPIQVRALPKNKPAHFTGAVGRYKMAASVDAGGGPLEVGKPLNLIVKIEGVGNIKSIKEPALPEMGSFRRYEGISSSNINNEGKFIHGSKDFKILLIPQVSGQISLPSLSFSYFNPEQNQYVTESTHEIPLTVKPGAPSQGAPETFVPPGAGQATEGVKVVEKDIRFLKSGKISSRKKPFLSDGLLSDGLFITAALLPLIFAFGAVLTEWRTNRRITNAAHYRSREALRKAKKKLKNSKKLFRMQDPTDFYGVLNAAVKGYCADKLSIPASEMVWDEVDRQLAEKGVAAELRTSLREIWEEADMVRFGTTTFSEETREASLAKTQTLLEQLNEVLP